MAGRVDQLHHVTVFRISVLSSYIGDTVCTVSQSAFGADSRLRLGADGASGLGFLLKGGLGVSLRGDLSAEIDSNVGFGIGGGLSAGAGLSVDNQGETKRAGAFTFVKETSWALGAGPIGFYRAAPFESLTSGHGKHAGGGGLAVGIPGLKAGDDYGKTFTAGVTY